MGLNVIAGTRGNQDIMLTHSNFNAAVYEKISFLTKPDQLKSNSGVFKSVFLRILQFFC